jgi:alpha-mannosidase
MRAVSNNHRELPPVSMGRSVDEFFDYLSKSSRAGATLPVWRGELYLEFHRGTYTSHGAFSSPTFSNADDPSISVHQERQSAL